MALNNSLYESKNIESFYFLYLVLKNVDTNSTSQQDFSRINAILQKIEELIEEERLNNLLVRIRDPF